MNPARRCFNISASVFLLIGLIFPQCDVTRKENFQESPALSELNRGERRKNTHCLPHISSGTDIGMLYWSLGGATLLLQMKYNAVCLVPPMTSLRHWSVLFNDFPKVVDGYPGITGPPLMQRIDFSDVDSFADEHDLLRSEEDFVAQAEYWYASLG